MLKPHPEFPEIKERVLSRIQAPGRSEKYAYATLGQIPHNLLPHRLQFLSEYHVLLREMDDIADGNAPVPQPYGNRTEYLERKSDFLIYEHEPCDDVERVMQRCFQRVGKAFGQNAVDSLWQSTKDIIDGLIFDRTRRAIFEATGTPAIYSEKTIKDNIEHTEIDGEMRSFLAVLGDDPEQEVELAPLIIATRRHFFFLRDMISDIQEGCINMSAEDLWGEDWDWQIEELQGQTKASENSIANLYLRAPSFARQWMQNQYNLGTGGLEVHRKSGATKKLRRLTRTLLYLLYEKPASQFFAQFSEILTPSVTAENT